MNKKITNLKAKQMNVQYALLCIINRKPRRFFGLGSIQNSGPQAIRKNKNQKSQLRHILRIPYVSLTYDGMSIL